MARAFAGSCCPALPGLRLLQDAEGALVKLHAGLGSIETGRRRKNSGPHGQQHFGEGSRAGGGQQVGTDGGKKVRGRKRHIVVDTLGLLLAVVVTAANIDDAKAAQRLFAQMPSAKFYRLEQVQADSRYRSPALDRWLRVHHRGYEVVVVSREPGERRFVPLRSRWVVERTFAWLGRYRRHSRDYERFTESSESMLKISSIHQMLNRLKSNSLKQPPFKYPKLQEKITG